MVGEGDLWQALMLTRSTAAAVPANASTSSCLVARELATCMLNHFPCAVIMTDVRHQVAFANVLARRQAKLHDGALLHLSLGEVFSAMRLNVATAWVLQKMTADGVWRGEVHVRPGGAEVQAFWLHAQVVEGADAQTPRTHLFVLSDITHLILREHRLRWLAETDALTGLANRNLFIARLDEAVELAKSDSSLSPSVLFIDLDGFKQVNDQLGHGAGDGILCEVAKMLETSVRANDMAARIGGDEFVVLLIGATHSTLVETAQRINERLLFELVGADAQRIKVTGSIGAAVFPHDGHDAKSLLKLADKAMYAAKRSGKNRYCFASENQPLNQAGETCHE